MYWSIEKRTVRESLRSRRVEVRRLTGLIFAHRVDAFFIDCIILGVVSRARDVVGLLTNIFRARAQRVFNVGQGRLGFVVSGARHVGIKLWKDTSVMYFLSLIKLILEL